MYSLKVILSLRDAVIYPLRESYVIGRNQACGIHLPYEFVSRRHCTLISMPPNSESEYPYFKIKDGGLLGKPSINGTWVNGDRISLVRLKHQDIITFSRFSVFPRAEFCDERATVMAEIGTDSHERIK